MDQLDVINIQRRELNAVDISRPVVPPVRQPVKKPDVYDKVVDKTFWFVVGFSIALMLCCLAFGQTFYA